jgi:uncharacterized protein YkwD
MPRRIAAGSAAIFACFVAIPAAGAAPSGSLLAAMNEARAVHGLRPLRLDPALVRAARAHSADMIRRDYFAHGAVRARLARFGVSGPRVGENLAWAVGSAGGAREIVRLWLRSPRHRANLLRPGFRRVGIGALAGRFAGHAGARVVTADFAGR